MQIPFIFLVNAEADGFITFAVIDRRLWQPNVPLDQQLANCQLYDMLTIEQALNIGAGLVATANAQVQGIVQRTQERKLAETAAELAPVTEEERARLAAIMHGFTPDELDPETRKEPLQ